MLATLLPGLREVRAPLAAGFIWMIALWFLLEPRWPSGDDDGVTGSANRLLDNLSVFGQGVVVSFTAYVLGSFSVFLFSRYLLDLLRSTSPGDTGRLNALSELGEISLRQVAIDGRERLEQALALSGLEVGDILKVTRPVAREHRTRRRGPGPEDPRLVGPSLPPPPEIVAEREISQRVLLDLPAVADAQLLGKESEVFSAVDRSQAEVDFRVALVPAVAGLAAALALASVPDDLVLGAISLVVGGLAAVALMLDAARQRRGANELILSLMEHGRIIAPSVLRAESAAVARADQSPGKVLARQGEATARALRTFMHEVAEYGDSGVFSIGNATRASERAHEESARLDQLMSQYVPPSPASPERHDSVTAGVLQPLSQSLREIERALGATFTGEEAWSAEVRRVNEMLAGHQRRAAEAFDTMVRRVRTAVAEATADDVARSALGDSSSDSGSAQLA